MKAIELGPFANETDLLDDLKHKGSKLTKLVPDCVGLSVASPEHGVTFTLIASDRQLAFLDGIQDLCGSMEMASRPDPHPGDVDQDSLDEETWQLLAMASAARGVVSTLTMPIVKDGCMPGRSTCTAHPARRSPSPRAAGRALGGLGARCGENADLSFSTRRDAEQAPRRLRNESTVSQAACRGRVRGRQPVDAHRRIREAALRAGITEEQLAEAVIRLRGRPD